MTLKSARALLRRRNTSAAVLEWWIDRQHVGTPDDDIASQVRARMMAVEPNKREPANVIEAATVIAVARHQANRATFRMVTGGIR